VAELRRAAVLFAPGLRESGRLRLPGRQRARSGIHPASRREVVSRGEIVRPRVILLHGLWMPGMAMHWLAGRLQAAGFETEVFSYSSIADGPDLAVPRLIETIGDRETHIVAHSL